MFFCVHKCFQIFAPRRISKKCESHFPGKLACVVLSLQCSKTCGEGGYQHRQVKCQSHTGEVLADTLCSAVERPSEHNKCDLPHCPINSSSSSLIPVAKEYQWRAGMWSKVSFWGKLWEISTWMSRLFDLCTVALGIHGVADVVSHSCHRVYCILPLWYWQLYVV